MLSSRHDMAVAHINAQQRWLPTQDLHKIKPIKNSRKEEGRTPEAPPSAEELLAVDGCWGKKSHFSLGVWPLESCPCPSRRSHILVHVGRH